MLRLVRAQRGGEVFYFDRVFAEEQAAVVVDGDDLELGLLLIGGRRAVARTGERRVFPAPTPWS